MSNPRFSLAQRVRHIVSGDVYLIIQTPVAHRLLEASAEPFYGYEREDGAGPEWYRAASVMEQRFEPADGSRLDGSRFGPATVDDAKIATGNPFRKLAGESATERPFRRASGDCICEVCHREYRRHSFTPDRDFNGDPFLHVLCNGDVVKL